MPETSPTPTSPSKPRASVVHLEHQWFPVARSEELGKKPLARTLQDVPLVLFRDTSGHAQALLDRCPHRNVPLSLGRVHPDDGRLECRYHGWRFAGDGRCTHVPSLTGPIREACHASSHPLRERQGFLWVYSTADTLPRRDPFHFEYLDRPDYTTVVQTVDAEASMYSTIENALDVPHTAFLHRGLFRAESRNLTIRAKVRRQRHRVDVEYLGEPRPEGVVARLLSPSGGMVTHFDRFQLPSVTQVEYRIGDENHLIVDAVMCPVSAMKTRIFSVVSFKTRLPARLIQPLVKPLALRIFKQDAVILKAQTETIERFGGERFASTEIDVIGKHVWRLLREAERGQSSLADDAVHEEEATLIL